MSEQGVAPAWLYDAINEQGVECGNCEEWRVMVDPDTGDIETCQNCGDERFNVYVLAAKEDSLP
jgi:hypothetical protein